MNTFATNHPILFAVTINIVWLLLLIVLMGISAEILNKPYGDALTITIARSVVTIGVLVLIWRLKWLKTAGITHLGNWQTWLLTLGGLLYLACASLYAFYGKVAFDFSSVWRLPQARTTIVTLLVVAMAEEILFRGLLLHSLFHAWGNTTPGIILSASFSALLFAVLHITQVVTNKASLTSTVLLVLQTALIALWWAALVLSGGSIWPAVGLHFTVSVLIAIQGLTVRLIEPEILAYRQLLWFSIPLGLLGLGLLFKLSRQHRATRKELNS